MNILYLIPARGGSKGIPHKNIKPLAGKPLIYYSIDVARELTTDDNICVSTDDDEIIKVVEDYGLKVPFKRPEIFSTDTASTNDVINHALCFYENINIFYDVVVLLQPTSPIRETIHIKEAMQLLTDNIDMIISVKESHSANVLCIENDEKNIELLFNKKSERRQDLMKYYEYNGSIYIIRCSSIKKYSLLGINAKKKYVMSDMYSIDIDTLFDFLVAECVISNYK